MSCIFFDGQDWTGSQSGRSSRKAWPFCDWSLTNGHWQRWSWLSPPSFGKAGGAFTQFGVSASLLSCSFPLNCSFLLTALLPKTTATILKTTKLGLLLKVKFEHIIVSSCCDHYYYHIIFIIVAAVVGGGGGLQWVQCVESITVWGVLEKSTDPAAEAAAAKAHVEVFQNHSKQMEQTAKWQAHFLVTMAKGDMSIMNIMNWSLKVVSWIPWQWLKQKKRHPCCFSVSRCSETWLWPENWPTSCCTEFHRWKDGKECFPCLSFKRRHQKWHFATLFCCRP